MPKTLVLIDGHALAYRMYFALEQTKMRTRNSETPMPTWAVYGFFNAVFGLIREKTPDAIAVAFDRGRETFRNRIYPEYKAHREAMPDDLRAQMGLIYEGVEKLGIPVFSLEDFEADDLIGTIANHMQQQALTESDSAGWQVEILTGDQDAFQLVDEKGIVQVLIPSRSPKEPAKLYDWQGVITKWGVRPDQVIDFKALKGDTSDNIPGVPGVGDKTAVKLLSEFDTLDNLYANIEQVQGKLKEKLITYKDQAYLSQTLATINRQSPIEFNLDACHLTIPDLNDLLAFLNKCEFKNFITQAPLLLAPFLVNGPTNGPYTAPANEVTQSNNNGSLPLFQPVSSASAPLPQEVAAAQTTLAAASSYLPEYELIQTEAAFNTYLSQLKSSPVFAIDFETTGLDTHTVDLVGIALSMSKQLSLASHTPKNWLHLKNYPSQFNKLQYQQTDPNYQTVYIPVGHTSTTEPQLDKAWVLNQLKPLLEDPNTCKIAHNAKYEINCLRQWGVEAKGLWFDTMVASYVQASDRRHGLKALGYDIFKYPMTEINTLIGTGKKQIGFAEVPIEQAAPYAAADAQVTIELAEHFAKTLDEDATALLYELELPLVIVLADMEYLGVSIDVPYLKGLSTQLAAKLTDIAEETYKLANTEFNINSSQQVAKILFEDLGISPLKKTAKKTGYSTDAKVLEQLADEHEIVEKILEYRQAHKLKSTYVDALPELVNPKTHRVHTSLNQTVAATGRLSSSDPNLQNIPIRTEYGRLIRNAFVPQQAESGEWVLLSADYSQIELRMLAHFSEDPRLVEAFQNGEDIHTSTAALVFGLSKDRVSKDMRYKSKAVNFGIIYGQTAHGLSNQLKIPRAEAQAFIDRYFRTYPNVQQTIEGIIEEAKQTGFAKTICGRSRDLRAGLADSNRNVREFTERAAFNTPLQGSAADLIKIAMIRLHKMLADAKLSSRMILQVHDELVLEVYKPELEVVQDLVYDAMALDQTLKVPLVIDVSIGNTWLEA